MARRDCAEATRMRSLRRTLVTLTLAGVVLVGGSSASAQTTTAPVSPTSVGGAPPTPTDASVPNTPPLAPAKADEAGRRQAQAALREAERATAATARSLAALKRRVGTIDRERARAESQANDARARQTDIDAKLAVARARLKGLAVASYVTGGASPQLTYLLEADGGEDFGRRTALVDSATAIHRATATAYLEARDAVTTELVDAVMALNEITAKQASLGSDIADAQAALAAQQAEVANRRLLLDLVTAAAPVAPTDIPRLVLDAYQRAILAMSVRLPACRIAWPAVAALGRIEANHARYRGAQFSLSGDVFPPIIGIPLDGTNKTQRILDTDDGLLDGDTVYDRAVGPMQFIPSTWARVGLDGNGDGVANPNNVYDATISAAYYLCRAVPTGGLDKEENLAKAFFSYNHSQSYVDTGLQITRIYGSQAGQMR